MAELSWREAIVKVLEDSGEPMSYRDIAEEIAKQGLRAEYGATPSATVNATISTSLTKDEEKSPFVRVTRGNYTLRSEAPLPEAEQLDEDFKEPGLIGAFGMYWSRSRVPWATRPGILGQEQPGSTPVNFCDQKGVYLLHDGRAVVYVGRTTDQPIGTRLNQHISDRLNGRWDRFSWFGVYPVADNGSLVIPEDGSTGSYSLDGLIATMEALLIEGLEPPQNRKRGDGFQAMEFLQVDDPDTKKKRALAEIAQLLEA